MILFGLLFLVFVISWVVFASSAKKDKEITPLYFILALFTTVGFIGSCAYMGGKNSDAVGVMAQRQYYQDLITNLSDDASFETVVKIVGSAEFISPARSGCRLSATSGVSGRSRRQRPAQRTA